MLQITISIILTALIQTFLLYLADATNWGVCIFAACLWSVLNTIALQAIKGEA